VSREDCRFLITGAAGFVGANLCRRLVQGGHEVHIVVKPTTRMWRIQDILGRLHVHRVDLTDAVSVDAVVNAVRPTIVYHLATHGAYPHQSEAEQILRTNVLGLWNLIRACSRGPCELLVNTGSSSEYGSKLCAMRETDRLDPSSFYGVAKAAQSLLCRHVGRTGTRAIVTLRLFSVYGPYEEPGRLIPNLMLAALDRTPIDMVSPDTARDFVYVDDVVDLYLEIEKLKGVGGEILNVGTGQQTDLRQLVATQAAVGGESIQARWETLRPRAWDTPIWVADISRLRRLMGRVPRTGVEEGLSRTLAWFRENHRFYRRPSGPDVGGEIR
jgi:nucleoside-diphosphate-sugar epimerase